MAAVLDPARPDLGGNLRFGDVGTWAPELWDYLIDRFALRSMLDVGCGEGHAVAYFHKRGVFAHGIDGLLTNVKRSVVPIAQHDLLRSAYTMPVDFVWSCEVAEHIAPENVDLYIDTLANGKIVAMTHALPGQFGHHHVNCREASYWVELLRQRGLEPDPMNDIYRHIASTGKHFNYFGQTGMVFLSTR